jgi:thiamine-phosphate pyrophosphorylase
MAIIPFRLMLVTDRTLLPPGALVAAVDRAVAGGVDAVQLREKDVPEAELLALGRELRAVTCGRALLLLNGPARLARALGADGVHLPENAAQPEAAERAGLLLGRSVHDAAGAEAAERAGVDYLVVGTVYPSRSHPGGLTGGQDLVRNVCERVRLPVVGIGGITATNAGEVMHAGAAGVAVISAVLAAPDPRAAAERLAGVVRAAATCDTEERA